MTVDYDKNQFLQDVFEALLALPGDPVAQIDRAVADVVADHVNALKKLAQAHRTEILDMAEERQTTGKPVATKWKV